LHFSSSSALVKDVGFPRKVLIKEEKRRRRRRR
jgi:hypothetical protein